MSYARFSDDSDVYVFLSVTGQLECCGCALDGRRGYFSTDELLAHLEEHVTAGHAVPDYCTERLIAERDENDAYIASGGDEDAF